MKIVVLCGGLSTERKISFSSGTQICKALRQKGHQAVLVDLFLGLEDEREEIRKNPAQLFEELPSLKEVVFDGNAPDLEALKKGRKLQSPSLFGAARNERRRRESTGSLRSLRDPVHRLRLSGSGDGNG